MQLLQPFWCSSSRCPHAAATPKRASLKLASLSPLVVRGSDFARGERIVLTASAPSLHRAQSVVAGRNGSFVARFGLRIGRCVALTIRAVGVQGSRAILQVEPGCRRDRIPRPRDD